MILKYCIGYCNLQDIEKSADGNYFGLGHFISQSSLNASSISKPWIIKFDEDGHLLPDPLVDIVYPSFTENIKVFPNPTQGILYVEHDLISNVKYQLYDQTGKIVVEKVDTDSFHTYFLSMDHLNPGLYYLHIISEEGQKHIEKIILGNN